MEVEFTTCFIESKDHWGHAIHFHDSFTECTMVSKVSESNGFRLSHRFHVGTGLALIRPEFSLQAQCAA